MLLDIFVGLLVGKTSICSHEWKISNWLADKPISYLACDMFLLFLSLKDEVEIINKTNASIKRLVAHYSKTDYSMSMTLHTKVPSVFIREQQWTVDDTDTIKITKHYTITMILYKIVTHYTYHVHCVNHITASPNHRHFV